MKIKSGFELRDVCGEKLIIAQGIENVDFSKMINLNESATMLWEKAVELGDFTEEQLVDALCNEYEVEREVAAKDVHELVNSWRNEGLLD